MDNLKRYRTLIKGDSMVDYDIPKAMNEFKADANKAYEQLLRDNDLDPSAYRPSFSKPGYINDDFIYNKFTVIITAVPIK